MAKNSFVKKVSQWFKKIMTASYLDVLLLQKFTYFLICAFLANKFVFTRHFQASFRQIRPPSS